MLLVARSLHFGLEASNIVSTSFLLISPLQVKNDGCNMFNCVHMFL